MMAKTRRRAAKDIVRVCGLHEVNRYLGRDPWAEQVISILDPDIRQDRVPVVPNNLYHKIVYMLDEEHPGEWTPTRSDTIDILYSATNGLAYGRRTLIHCHAGMSRSATHAMGILMLHGYSVKESIDEIERQRAVSGVDPNLRIVGYIDDILNLRGEFIEQVNVRFPPYTWSTNRSQDPTFQIPWPPHYMSRPTILNK